MKMKWLLAALLMMSSGLLKAQKMKKILFVVTSHATKGSTGEKTGYYLGEVSHPWKVLTAAGYEIDFVSPEGGNPPVDGFDLNDPVNKEFWENGIMQFAMENWWVSDYPAYVKKGNAEMDVQALEDSFVLGLGMEARAELATKVPQMMTFWERKALSGYVATQKRVLSLLRNSAKEKYELLLDQYPQLFQRVPKKMIAHYLGVSRETLSRLHKYD